MLVATSDLDEALEVGDRIVVLNHGRLTADLPLADATRERLIDAMSSRPDRPPSQARGDGPQRKKQAHDDSRSR